MDNKLWLGQIEGYGSVFIEKHKWDCSWYWAFGYLGNNQCHFHIESLITRPETYNPNWTEVTEQFTSTWLTQDQWWILRDLFIQAYALKKAAACYRHGGYQTESARPHNIISKDLENTLNADLEKLLDNIWELLTEWKPETVK